MKKKTWHGTRYKEGFRKKEKMACKVQGYKEGFRKREQMARYTGEGTRRASYLKRTW